ncbi:MAG: spore cortex biosynthesis protein YabQ [Clostridiales bacterium]|nr:spore cortex biosynthesis protein YabQ [Clostridiales bacterium]
MWSIFAGFILAFIYDVFRIYRKLIKTNDFFVTIQDISFFLVSALIIFFVAYKLNSSRMRMFEFFAILLGMIFYKIIFKDFILIISVKFINILIKISLWFWKKLTYPVVFLWKILKKPCRLVIWYSKRSIEKVKYVAKLENSIFKNYLKSIKGYQKNNK